MQLPHNSLYARRENDFYATRDQRAVPSLVAALESLNIKLEGTIADFCCGEGHILRHFETSHQVFGSDIVHRGYKHQREISDLHTRTAMPGGVKIHISNLPYDRKNVNTLTAKLIQLAKEAKGTLCLLFRHQFAAGFDKQRRALFETPHFVGEFRLPYRPFFELPVMLWGKNVTPSPQHPYAWYIWDFSKEWHGITRYAPVDTNLNAFLPEDIEAAHEIDTVNQRLLLDALANEGQGYLDCFNRMRAKETVVQLEGSWQFMEGGEPIPPDLMEALKTNTGPSRNRHLGRIEAIGDKLPMMDDTLPHKWAA